MSRAARSRRPTGVLLPFPSTHSAMDWIHSTLQYLVRGESLSEDDSRRLFGEFLSGNVDAAQIGAALALIARRSASVDELVGGARAMRQCVTRVEPPPGRTLIDTCGTGGAPKTFNVSTLGALVTVAACPERVAVAKHGSVSKTGRGSAEIMSALGVNTAASPERQGACLRELGICFSFSQHHHPAMKHIAPTRKALGFPTIFNLLGPLTNPAGATRQLIGTFNPDVAESLAQTLHRLGADRAMVVTSEDGLDELSPTSPASVWQVSTGGVCRERFDPASVGIARCSFGDLSVDTLAQAVVVFRSVLNGDQGPRLDAVLLNSGASLVVAGCATDVREGIELARAGIHSGRASRLLDDLVRLSNF